MASFVEQALLSNYFSLNFIKPSYPRKRVARLLEEDSFNLFQYISQNAFNSREADMWYVYMLKSKMTDWRYLGSTGDLKKRFKLHNEGEVQSTKHYAPFELEAYVAVQTEKKARELEKYFKTGSGRTVLRKRILQSTKL